MTNHIFTPRDKDGNRLAMLVNRDDKAKMTGGGKWNAEITDQRDGKLYLVKGASCGIPRCYCDAQVIKEIAAVEVIDASKEVPESQFTSEVRRKQVIALSGVLEEKFPQMLSLERHNLSEQLLAAALLASTV